MQFTTLAIRLLSDHLGSASAVVSADGTAAQTQGYYPWGETRFGSLETEYQYTGQYRLAALGLDYFNARWYDSALGRFAQADSIVPLASQGAQAWDRYAFVNNNPVRYTDPSGYYACGRDSGMGDRCDSEDDPFAKVEIIDAITYVYGWDFSALDVRTADYWNLSVYSSAPVTLIAALIGGASIVTPGPDEAIFVPIALAQFITRALSLGLTITIDRNGNIYLSPGISAGRNLLTGEYPSIILSAGHLNKSSSSSQLGDFLTGFSNNHGISIGPIGPSGILVNPGKAVNSFEFGYGTPFVNFVTINYGIPIYNLRQLFSGVP